MGSEARARIGLTALLLVVLFSMSQVLEGGSFAGPALLGGIAATAIAMIARRLGLSVIVSLLLSAAALVWYLVIIFQSDATLFLLPTPKALGGLIASIERAYEHSRVDFAPVPTRPGYVALVTVAFWGLVTLGEIATFRWRRPLLASLGPLAMFAFVQVIGTTTASAVLVPAFMIGLMTYWGLESSHRLRSWGRWVSTFTGRTESEPRSVTGDLARRMGAACVIAAVAAPVFLPSLGNGLVAWRNSIGDGGLGPGSGGGGGGSIDPLVSVVPELITQTDTELFRVTSERPQYWRIVTLANFDGQTWTPEGEPDTPSPSGAIATDIAVPTPGQVVEQNFEILELESRDLPAAVLPATVQFTGESEDLQADLDFDPTTADLQLETPTDPGVTYSVQSTVPTPSYNEMRRARIGDPLDRDRYLHLPQTDARVFDLAERWTKDAESPFDKLLAIQRRFRTDFDYSLGVDTSASSDYLLRFLTESRVGYCQQFATAFAVMSRLLGYPTRVAVGFLPGSTSPEAPNAYTVRGTDAHAWPEVYFQGVGWVAFEPTPRSETAPPGYTLDAVQTDIAEAAGPNPRGPENAYENPAGGGGAGNLQQFRDPDAGVRGPGTAPGGGPQRANERWERRFAALTRVLIVVVVLFLASVPLLKEWRTRRRYARARDAGDGAAAAFAEFEGEATELVSRRLPSESARSYADRLARTKTVPRAPALELAGIFERSQYSPMSVEAGDSAKARRLARELRRSLWNGASWWERGNRLFSPAGLRGRKAA